MSDLVNQPPHYTSHESGVECITIAEHMPFNAGNALKYAWRLGLKESASDDRAKCCWYLRREAERLNAGAKSLPVYVVRARMKRVLLDEPKDSPLAMVLRALLQQATYKRVEQLREIAGRLERTETTNA